jgi:hypothetical protein
MLLSGEDELDRLGVGADDSTPGFEINGVAGESRSGCMSVDNSSTPGLPIHALPSAFSRIDVSSRLFPRTCELITDHA